MNLIIIILWLYPKLFYFLNTLLKRFLARYLTSPHDTPNQIKKKFL